MPSDFVHLHVHSHYSLLDGACTTRGLLDMAREFDMPAVAITDHGFLGAAQEFYKTFMGSGVKSIIGCEAYVAPGSRFDKSQATPHVRGFHLLLLAENNAGYHSLCKLISEGFRTGAYYGKPRIDKELLAEHHDGLIAMSACIAGEIPQRILEGDMPAAEKSLREYLDIFGADHFFLEVMDHGIEEERKVARALADLAGKFNLGLVATNDAHYLKKEHAKAHEIMLCIQTGALLSDPRHFRFSGPEYYFKSADEMAALFRELPGAIANTRAIAERCEVTFRYAPDVNHYPVYTLPDGTVPGKEFLREICLKNIPVRYHFDPESPELTPEQRAVIDRMDYELDVIDRTQYCSYFLVVSDFIRHAKEQGVPVGPGRGSGAGSLVAYLTQITNIDPLRYNLLFERFLNPERVNPPDFDIDFCEKRRGEVIEYVRQKYGQDSVAQICTYGALKAKAVLKDVARVLGHDFEFGNRISKLVPDEVKMTLAKAVEKSGELAALVKSDPEVAEVFSFAEVLEGLNRQLGIHAAGVIIGDQRLDNLVPLASGAGGETVTQFTAGPCEELGLLKMDFLGLRTLTIIRNALDMIEEHHGVALNMDELPLDDPKTYDLLRRGDTVAVFQLESGGMQNLCRQFGVESIEHIIALLAIYRPGPMQFIPQFVRRKKGEEEIVYDHPKMERILKETYGIMLYQEQIMQVVQELAGFSLGGADILRRAIGKKKADEMERQKAKFLEGCAKTSGISESLAKQIWEKIEMFAGYGFNKSHSAAYAMVAYQTAYLKANYPVEFMAAVLTSELANADEIAFLINACRDMGIKVLPPNVNSSQITFGVDDGAIRFGLGAIKGVGEIAARKIIESRQADGKYKSFQDFCERCGGAMNSRMMEHLTRAGAFDQLGLRRSQLLAIAEPMLKFAASRTADLASGQGSLFDLLDGEDTRDSCSVPIPDIPEFSREEILKSEKELLGFYVTGHPLEPYVEIVRGLSSMPIRDVGQVRDNASVRLAGMVGSFSTKFSKSSGKPMGILVLEDMDSAIECMLYERILGEIGKAGLVLTPGLPILVEARVNYRDDSERPRLAADRIMSLDEGASCYAAALHLYIRESDMDRRRLEDLARLCKANAGDTPLVMCVEGDDGSVFFIEPGADRGVRVTTDLLKGIETLLGARRCRVKGKPCEAGRARGGWRRSRTPAAETA